MTVSLTKEKIKHITDIINNKMSRIITVKELASLVGTLVAAFPGVEYGQLYYRSLECLKINSLRESHNYKRKICLSNQCISELNWWLNEGLFSSKKISHGNPDFVLQSDSSGYGWGALLLNNSSKTQGHWSSTEQQLHINVLELQASFLGLKALCGELSDCHIQLQLDNTTAVCYINNMGGTHSKLCNSIARELITWSKERGIWVSATHVAGSLNSADVLSRVFNDDIEWKLNERLFSQVCEVFGIPEVDLFASRINHQVKSYFSYYPDSNAVGINAFAHKWNMFPYIFPPFNLIPRCLRKLREDKTCQAILIAPTWPAAPWWPTLQKMLLKPPLLLQSTPSMLVLPHKVNKMHPLLPKLKLRAYLLSGKTLKTKE